MKQIKTNVIALNQQYYEIDSPKELDRKAICCFVATGFFLDEDTYWTHQKVFRPASNHILDSNGFLEKTIPYFKWHYSPRDISFNQALDEFSNLFEQIIFEQTHGKKVILPLSGGLDSRTQAAALLNHPNLQTYSYAFKNGYPEHKISKQIAAVMDKPFNSFEVSKGYLWECIEELAELNQCYSDFTNPRQMAFIDKYKEMGDIFSLGHWGDVLFDGLGDVQWNPEQEINWILKKIVKKGGMEFASSLWSSWNLEGDFKSYFIERLHQLLSKIDIENTSAKLRAFKSLYWAPRWTSINLGVFESVKKIALPYYDNRMCEFICTIPEKYLANRQLQIAYIQRKSKKLASITWHEQKPFNLNNYQWNKYPYNFPYRVYNKLYRTLNNFIGKPHISRNWELQFLGKENDIQLKKWLFESKLNSLIDESITEEIYISFKSIDSVYYSHPLNMLLVLSIFNKKYGF